ncbi:MAG: sugar phosphate isomerase/epimerase [Candidatus Heimdallarchaeota archaeon]|nr:MAG: sugar phosphate isomerase/epimerase [Candidatus Heimdallarchaeota archaeon]
MTFTTGLTIQRLGDISPSMWLRIASNIQIQHIEFDLSVFNDIENVIQVLKAPQTTIHAPYVEDYGMDLSSNNEEIDQFVENVNRKKNDLRIIGVVVHPPEDASGSLDRFYDRLDKLPFPLLENMPHQPWDDFLAFIKNTQANINREIGMCFDIPHSYITNSESFLDLPELCRDFLQKKSGYIHISGGTREEDTHFPSLSDGDMPLDPIRDFLKDIKFSGTVTMELRPQSIDDLDKIFQSYMYMLQIAGKTRHRLQVRIKRPFIMRKVRQKAKNVDWKNPRNS